MNIAILGTAPSSVRLAPFGDASWLIWACSPGTYPILPRCDAFFEIHRQEAPVIGKADKQVPWFSPEYWAWLGLQKLVWMYPDKHPDIANSRRLPVEMLVDKYGMFFFTSSIAWMMAMAIEAIEAARQQGDTGEHSIGLWGVDMSATEEYGFQRAGCQFFVQVAADLGIKIVLPPESDLMTPPPMYGVFESTHRGIKLTARLRELQQNKANIESTLANVQKNLHYVNGAIDDLQYIMNNWMFDGDYKGAEFKRIFNAGGDIARKEPGEQTAES